ncbi:MAG: hypothetical protein HXY20_13285 [Acidobacteria bacterium]|nr:hypothetical protein [Acidobacteriota bacterium]
MPDRSRCYNASTPGSEKALEARKRKEIGVEAGREVVEAYVTYTHS